MTSRRKITANQADSRRSSGPRTAAGKLTASRNSRKHGLAALSRQPAGTADVERLAEALCGNQQDPVLLAKARRIAEAELVLQATRAHKLAVIERLRDPNAHPFAAGDNRMALAQARSEQGKQAQEEIERRLPNLLQKYQDQLSPILAPDDLVTTEHLIAILLDLTESSEPIAEEQPSQLPEPGEPQNNPPERDEFQALEAAAPDLDALQRYESRAWSRQMRAMRDFAELERDLDATAS